MVSNTGPENLPNDEWEDDYDISFLDLALTVSENLKLLIFGPLLVGILTLVYTFFITPVFTAKTTILPPAQASSTAGALLDSLGVAGFAGSALGLKDPAGQYMAYIESDALLDILIDKFNLQKYYDQKYIFQTRKILRDVILVDSDKKSGLITVAVTDKDPKLAAELANSLITELRFFVGKLELQEAQNRRAFLETQLKEISSRPFLDAFSQQALISGLIRQFELSKVDEARIGPTFMQVDVAAPPELKSGPKRAQLAVLATLATGLVLLIYVFIRKAYIRNQLDPESQGMQNQIISNIHSFCSLKKWFKK
jgi:capsular polysaccharide biosynthesis protein